MVGTYQNICKLITVCLILHVLSAQKQGPEDKGINEHTECVILFMSWNIQKLDFNLLGCTCSLIIGLLFYNHIHVETASFTCNTQLLCICLMAHSIMTEYLYFQNMKMN